MTTIKMTAEQTQAYDSGDAITTDALMRRLRAEARNLAHLTNQTVEVVTSDGVVVHVEVAP